MPCVFLATQAKKAANNTGTGASSYRHILYENSLLKRNQISFVSSGSTQNVVTGALKLQ